MAQVDLFSKTTHMLRRNGGDVDVFVRMKRADVSDIGERISVDEATVKVRLTVPFTFSGESLSAIAEGTYVSEEPWSCFSRLHQRAKVEGCADIAMSVATQRLADAIPPILREARPTVSNKKVERKTRAILKLLTEEKPK